MAQGGHGAISVSANVAPKLCAQVHKEWSNHNIDAFQELNALLAPLHDAAFFESSPAPIKYAVSQLGICTDHVRQPLLSASDECRAAIDHAMSYAGLLENTTAKSANG